MVERRRPQRPRYRDTGIGVADASRADGNQVGPERPARQWAWCGSVQEESRVTTSNSRSSLATT